MFIMHIEHRPLTGYLSQMLVLAQAVLQLENQLNGPLGNFFCVGKSPDVEEHIKLSHSWTRGKLDWKSVLTLKLYLELNFLLSVLAYTKYGDASSEKNTIPTICAFHFS